MPVDADRHSDETNASEQFDKMLNASEPTDGSPELEYLRQVANGVRDLPQPMMPAADKAALRATMLTEFRKQHTKPTVAPVVAPAPIPIPTRKSNQWRDTRSTLRLIVAACLIVAFVFGGGALRISAASVPGEPFYGLKRFTEHVSLIFTSGESRTQLLADMLLTRLAEIKTLIARGQTITESVANDTIECLNEAMHVEPDQSKREQLMGQTAVVFTQARTQGNLGQETLLVALNELDVPPDEFFAASAAVQPVPTLTLTQTPTDSVVVVPAISMTPTAMPSQMPTNTATETVTNTATATDRLTFTPSSTYTATATYTTTSTDTPTFTATYTVTASSTNTDTPTSTFTASATWTPSATSTDISSATPTFTATPRPSATPRVTRTPRITKTPKPANTRRPPTKTPKPPPEKKPDNPGGKPGDAGGGKPPDVGGGKK